VHAAPADTFHHEALFYDGEGSFLAGTMPFIRAGLHAGEPVLAVLGADKIALLTDMLGADAASVRFADMAEVGANPARIIPAWREFLDAHGGPGRPVRGIGEPIWAGRSAAELVECQLHEALLNRAFATADGFRLLCPYDTSALPDGVLREACCSHPVLAEGEERRSSADYRGEAGIPATCEAPLPPPPAAAHVLSFDADTLADVRAVVAECAEAAGIEEPTASDLVLAVHELATNSVLHGGGIGVLRAWRDEAAVVCEVRDRGRLRDPLAGRSAPRADQLGGWGLWIANRVCDLVQVRTGAAGTVVRARLQAA